MRLKPRGGGLSRPRLSDRLLVLLQHAIPQHLLSRWAHKATRCKLRWWKNTLIRWFTRFYHVDMSIAKEPERDSYPDFNSFFTRELRSGVRTLARNAGSVIAPVDGWVSEIGDIQGDGITQAKGRRFTLSQLLGGDPGLAKDFRDGSFTTLYLSPREYHRVHMPIGGRLREMVYIPGRLFAVNPRSVRIVNGLFARNERVVSVFDTDAGLLALIMVGAIFVGSMDTVWHGAVTPARARTTRRWCYDGGAVHLDKGAEVGRFNMGSTVILLFKQGAVRWSETLSAGERIQMGQSIATLTPAL
ncbi:MAG: archaetidylserine decarboxylase [Gammaproteobacteria bacterium]